MNTLIAEKPALEPVKSLFAREIELAAALERHPTDFGSAIPAQQPSKDQMALRNDLPAGAFFTRANGKCGSLAYPVWVTVNGGRKPIQVNAVVRATGDCIAVHKGEPICFKDPKPDRKPHLCDSGDESAEHARTVHVHGKPFLVLQEGIEALDSWPRRVERRRVSFYDFSKRQLVGNLPRA